MKKISRRNFGKIVSSVGVASAFGMPSLVLGASRKVVVIGGGFGGATAAKYLRKLNSNLEWQKKNGVSIFLKAKVLQNQSLGQLMFTMEIIFWKLVLVMESLPRHC